MRGGIFYFSLEPG